MYICMHICLYMYYVFLIIDRCIYLKKISFSPCACIVQESGDQHEKKQSIDV